MRVESVRTRPARRAIFAAAFLLFILLASAWYGQSVDPARPAAGQWLTFGHDPQRSGYASDELTFARQNVVRLGLVWSANLPNAPRALNGLTAPLVVRQGAATMVIVGGSSDHLFALDTETGARLWTADFTAMGKPSKPEEWLCPNALNATPVVDPAHGRVFAIASDGQLHTIALRDGRPLQSSFRFVPPFSKMWSLNYVGGVLYTTLGQDCNGGRSGFYAVDPDAPGHPVTVFWTALECGRGFCGAGAWGRGGPAIDFDGFAYAATGDGAFNPPANGFGSSVVRVAPRTLTLADYYTPPNWEYITKQDLDMGNTTPVVFRWRDRVLVATGGKEGVIYLMDSKSMGGGDHRTARYVSPRYSNDAQSFEKYGVWGGLSAWPDGAGRVWLYVPTWGPVTSKAPSFPLSYGPVQQGTVMAFQVVADASGRPTLQPAWFSRDISAPAPVAIANGIVFALESGENTEQVYNGDIRRLIKDRSTLMKGHAKLFALDAETGRELWNSGEAITDWTHFSGLAIGAGKVFVTTHQGGVYAFGLTSGEHAALSPPRTSVAPTMIPPAAAAPPPANTSATLAAPPAAGDARCAAASDLYQQKCAMCHGSEGKGLASLHTPDFTDPQWQATRANAALLDAILNGKEGEGRMPGFKDKLTSEQADALIRCVIRPLNPARK